jgi:hypothetical protein
MLTSSMVRSPVLWSGAAVLVLGGVLSTYQSGVASGTNNVPANASRAMNSCSACHSSSGPTATRTNPPVTTLTVGTRVLNYGQQSTVNTTVTGGLSTTYGGFLCEVTAGTFTAGTGNHTTGTGNSVTQNNRSLRTWNYTWTAPNTAGPVEMTSVGLACSGSGSSGDKLSFTGFDPNATVGTPVRLYVLPAGLTNFGVGCPDGYGNVPVLGAQSGPTVGNASFGFHIVGAAPSTLGFLLMGFNPAGFTGINLGAAFGLTGCTGYVANPLSTSTTFSSAGNAMRGEGTCSFPFPIPNSSSFLGFSLDVQGAYIDNSVAATRAAPVTFTNGLRMVVQ